MKPKTILVVDDEFYTAEILTFVLEGEGFRVLSAFNGHDALEKLKLSQVDLIILDVMMPIMNGAEMVRLLREDPALKHIPVLITTALAERSVAPMFGEVAGVLRKPFLLKAVTARVHEILGPPRSATITP